MPRRPPGGPLAKLAVMAIAPQAGGNIGYPRRIHRIGLRQAANQQIRSLEQLTVRARSNQPQDSCLDVAILVVNEQPVWLNVALARTFVLARKGMVLVLLLQWAVVHQLLYDRTHFLPVVAT